MSEWKEYIGSKEQIAEMKASRDVIIRFKSSYELLRSSCFVDDFNDRLAYGTVTHYLICNPHPYADMICQQARTGQPVWIKISGFSPISMKFDKFFYHITYSVYVTTTPDWNIPNAEYSFTPFEEGI